MKKLLIAIAFLLFITKTEVLSKGPQGIIYTRHNLANWNVAADHFRTTNVNEVCVFCHTPHFAGEQPLWNRDVVVRTSDGGTTINVQDLNINDTAFYAYTSRYISMTPKKLGYQTLLCMSCHDGVTSMGVLYKTPKSLNGNPIQWSGNQDQIGKPSSPADIGNASTFAPNLAGYSNGVNKKSNAYSYYADGWGMMFGVYKDNTGNILGNTADHPISVDYDYVISKKPADFKSKNSTGLTFFDIDGGNNGNLLECSTCHDPHVNYTTNGGDTRYTPFLAKINSSSNLCFTCHIK